MATPSKPCVAEALVDAGHEARGLVAPDLRVGDVVHHHRLGAVVDQGAEGDEVGGLELGQGRVVDRLAEVRITRSAVAGEVLHRHGHARRAQPVGEGAGQLAHLGRVGAEAAIADHARAPGRRRGRPPARTPSRRRSSAASSPISVAKPRPPRRPSRPSVRAERTGWSSAPIAVTRPPSSSMATSRCSPSRARSPSTSSIACSSSTMFSSRSITPPTPAVDQLVDQRVGRLGDAGQADDEHEARAVFERGSGAHRDLVGVGAPRVGVGGRLAAASPRVEHDEATDPDEQAHRQQRQRPAGSGRAPATGRPPGASVRTPARPPPPTRMTPVRGWFATPRRRAAGGRPSASG